MKPTLINLVTSTLCRLFAVVPITLYVVTTFKKPVN